MIKDDLAYVGSEFNSRPYLAHLFFLPTLKTNPKKPKELNFAHPQESQIRFK